MTRSRVLLATSNGAGMGHLSRQLSVALAGRETIDSTLFSLSVGLPVVLGHGVPGEYCPSYERPWMPDTSWNSYLRDRLEAIVEELEIDVVLFDGVAPYPGVLNARRLLPGTAFVWSRRGMWRPGVGLKHLKRGKLFDAVIEPGDLASGADRGPTADRTDAVRIPPISMTEVIQPVDRREAASALGLDPTRPTVLVTLGSGRLGDVAGPGETVIRTLLETSGWQIAVTRAAIAIKDVPLIDPSRVVEIRGVFPLVRYLAAFDAVVSAAGYNAVHEFVSAGIPTLLVPNEATRTDDQLARAEEVARRGLALVAHEGEVDQLVDGVRALLDDHVRAGIEAAIQGLPAAERSGGAAATADVVASLAGGYRASWSLRVASGLREADRSWREGLKSRLGPERTDRVRVLLGRPPRSGIGDALRVQIVQDMSEIDRSAEGALPLLVTEKIDREMIRGDSPVEHVIQGSSPSYRERRLGIVDRYYRVVS